MQKAHRSPAFLVELMLVILFFCISCTAILQLFAAAGSQSLRASLLDQARLLSENLADELYLSGDADALLQEKGFALANGIWQKDDESGLTLTVGMTDDSRVSGTLRKAVVYVLYKGETLLALPCDRYFPGEVIP